MMKDANNMFRSITGEWPDKIEPRLLRIPNYGLPITVQARYFVAHFMPKLNDMLLNSDKDKDVLILRKLKDSKYNTAVKIREYAGDKERRELSRTMRIDKKRIKVATNIYSSRNSATDWGVVKGPVRTRVRK